MTDRTESYEIAAYSLASCIHEPDQMTDVEPRLVRHLRGTEDLAKRKLRASLYRLMIGQGIGLTVLWFWRRRQDIGLM